MVITFNFKDSTETITFADLEKSALGSDFKVSGAPKNEEITFCGFFFIVDNKGLAPVKVLALRKQFSELFLAKSGWRVPNFAEIGSPSE